MLSLLSSSSATTETGYEREAAGKGRKCMTRRREKLLVLSVEEEGEKEKEKEKQEEGNESPDLTRSLSEALFPSSACLLLQVVLQGMKEAVDDNLSSPLVSDSEFGSCRYFTFPAFHFQEKYKGMTFLSRREENEEEGKRDSLRFFQSSLS